MYSQTLNVFTLGVRIGARKIFWVGTKMTYFYYLYTHSLGFPDGASDRRPACQHRRHKRYGFNPWLRKFPQKRSWKPTPVFFPGEFQGQRSLESYSSQGHKELDTTEVTQHVCMHIHSKWDYLQFLSVLSNKICLKNKNLSSSHSGCGYNF